MQKSFNQSAQFIKLFVRYTWFKSPTIFKAWPIFDHTHPVIIKVTFSFDNFAKNQPNSLLILDIQQILESWDLKDHGHFLSPPSKNY